MASLRRLLGGGSYGHGSAADPRVRGSAASQPRGPEGQSGPEGEGKMRKLRKPLSFANVMAAIAVFLVIGGSAYAGSKINGKKLKNNSVGPVKLHCPKAAASRTGDICYSDLQAAKGWIDAVQSGCPSLNLRLPTN